MKGVTGGRCLPVFLFLLAVVLLPHFVYAQVIISEFMYDPPGSDSGAEWVELFNAGTVPVDLTKWKINDGSNHVLNAPPKNGGSGSLVFAPNTYLIVAADAVAFRASHLDVSVSIIDTTLNLNNTAGSISLLNASGTIQDSINYSSALGASGTGDSLQRTQLISGAAFSSGIPTPGTSVPANGLMQTPQLPKAPKAVKAKATPKPKTVATKTSKITTANTDTPYDDSYTDTSPDSQTDIQTESQTASADEAESFFSGDTRWWLGVFALALAVVCGIVAARRFKKTEWDIVEDTSV